MSLYNIINSFNFLDAFFYRLYRTGPEVKTSVLYFKSQFAQSFCYIHAVRADFQHFTFLRSIHWVFQLTERHALIFPSVSFSHPSIFCIESPHLITTSKDTGTCSLYVSLSHNGKQKVFQIRNKLYFLSVNQTHYILCFPVWTTIEGFSKTK